MIMFPWYFLIFLTGVLVPTYAIQWRWFGVPFSNPVLLMMGLITIWFGIESKSIRSLWRIFRRPEVFLFLLWLTLGVLISEDQKASLGMWLYAGLLPLMTAMIMAQNRSMRRVFVQGLVWSGVWLTVLAIGQIIFSGDVTYRPTTVYAWGLDVGLAPGGFANYLGMILVPLVFLSREFVEDKSSWIITGVLILGVLASQSLTAIGSLCLVGIMALIQYQGFRRKRLLQWGLVMGVILSLFAAWQIHTPKIQNLTDMSQRNSLSSRVQIWQASTQLIQDNPVTGIGLVDYEMKYTEVIPSIAFPPHEWLVPHPHNLFMGVWLMGGLLGVVWLLVIIWQLFGNILHQVPYSRYSKLAFVSLLILGLVDFPFGRLDIMSIWWIALLSMSQFSPERRSLL